MRFESFRVESSVIFNDFFNITAAIFNTNFYRGKQRVFHHSIKFLFFKSVKLIFFTYWQMKIANQFLSNFKLYFTDRGQISSDRTSVF